MALTAAIYGGIAGLELTSAEAGFFRSANPWGFILFARNIGSPEQVGALTSALRDCVGREAPILIDQEGGRVARMGPPHWRRWAPVMNLFDGGSEETALEAARLRYMIIAHELRAVGIDVNCAPLLDIPVPEGHNIIGARALGTAAHDVTRRARVICEGLLAGGVLPVIKHIPGHGRAPADSHLSLPRVRQDLDALDSTDFVPFRELADQPLAMTAHVLFEAIDSDRCATLSPTVIELIRTRIGFGGLLMTDDISMKALGGGLRNSAAESLAAGCDVVLHCNGTVAEMEEVASAVCPLEGTALARAEHAEAMRKTPDPIDIQAASHRYETLTGEVLHA